MDDITRTDYAAPVARASVFAGNAVGEFGRSPWLNAARGRDPCCRDRGSAARAAAATAQACGGHAEAAKTDSAAGADAPAIGSGRIAAFDPQKGHFRGLLRGRHGHPITIEGLWALSFGNGAAAGPANTLFFTAGIDDEQHGLFGTLAPIPHENDEGDDGNED